MHFESLRVTAARYVSYRIGTLQVEFKYTASSKIHVLQDQFELPELPMASVESMKATNNVRKRKKQWSKYLRMPRKLQVFVLQLSKWLQARTTWP